MVIRADMQGITFLILLCQFLTFKCMEGRADRNHVGRRIYAHIGGSLVCLLIISIVQVILPVTVDWFRGDT